MATCSRSGPILVKRPCYGRRWPGSSIPEPTGGGYAWLRQAAPVSGTAANAAVKTARTALTRERDLLDRVRVGAGVPAVLQLAAEAGRATLAVSWPATKRGEPCRTLGATFPVNLPRDQWHLHLLLTGFRGLAATLSQLHARGVTHRNLSPDGIIVTANGRFILRDLGLAARPPRPGEGPPDYQAPEQGLAAGRARPGPATDVCQLACIAYHLVTGHLPAPRNPVPAHTLNPGLPEAVSDAIAAALGADREAAPAYASSARDSRCSGPTTPPESSEGEPMPIRLVTMPTRLVLVPRAGNLYQQFQEYSGREGFPRSPYDIVRDVAQPRDGVPLTFSEPMPGKDDWSLLAYTRHYVVRLFLTGKYGDAYSIASVMPLRLRDHQRLAEGHLLVRAPGWLTVDTTRDIPDRVTSGWEQLVQAWDALTSDLAVTAPPTPPQEDFLRQLGDVIDATERIMTGNGDGQRYPYREVKPTGGKRSGASQLYDFTLAGARAPEERTFVEVTGPARARGQVTRAAGMTVTVKFDDLVDWRDLAGQGELVTTKSGVVYRMQREAIGQLRSGKARNPGVLPALIERRVRPPTPCGQQPFFPLNERQREAFGKALAAPDLLVILGPPGTGKTRTITEIVRAASARERVIVCSQSNRAVDNVLKELPQGLLGDPGRQHRTDHSRRPGLRPAAPGDRPARGLARCGWSQPRRLPGPGPGAGLGQRNWPAVPRSWPGDAMSRRERKSNSKRSDGQPAGQPPDGGQAQRDARRSRHGRAAQRGPVGPGRADGGTWPRLAPPGC